MDWHCLGHAMWLAEVDGLRLLFDPLLENLHHHGVFEVFPPRTIRAETLAPDFVFVSHRHPDHFDPRSLRKLAELDPDTVLVTSDEMVAACGRTLGLRSVRVVGPETLIALDGPQLITTPSDGATEPEWGVLVASQEGVVYDQIDTSLGSPDAVRSFGQRVATVLGRPPESWLTLALARWQPLLEVESTLAGAIGFPFRRYARELEHCVALRPHAVCPSSAGVRHADRFGFMNSLVYPVTEARFRDDLGPRLPHTRIFPHRTGATFRVRGGEVFVDDEGARDLVSVGPTPDDPRDFRPVAIPALVDPNDGAEGPLRQRVAAFVTKHLAPALAARQPRIRHQLDVVFARTTDSYAIAGGVVRRELDRAWDIRCEVAGSLLVEVLDRRQHWGDLLLAGMLRGASRAADADGRPLPLAPIFLYEAISYEESVLCSIEHDLA